MDLTGKYLVIWLSAEAMETFLGVLAPRDETGMMSWIVGGEVVGESGPRLWVRVRRVLLPDGRDMPLPEAPTYFPALGIDDDRAAVRWAAAGHSTDRVVTAGGGGRHLLRAE